MQVGGDGVAFGFQEAEFVTAAHQDGGHALCFDNERRHGQCRMNNGERAIPAINTAMAQPNSAFIPRPRPV